MRAAQVVRLDGPEGVEVGEVEDPKGQDGQVLVEVRAAGLNFPDLLLTRGEYQLKRTPPFVLGSEFAGVVRSAPDGAGVVPGDRVVGMGTGSCASLIAVDGGALLPLPESVSFATGAALPVNYLTAHFGLTMRGQLEAGETVLVHGAAGGVGTATVQMAKALGATVIAVTSTAEKAAVASAAGADDVVLADGFRDAVKELTRGRGVDIVMDPVGGDRFTDSLRSLATHGRVLVVGFTAGDIPVVKVNRLLLGNIDVRGVAYGEYVSRHPDYPRRQWAEVYPHLESGVLDPPIGARLPLDRTGEGLEALAARTATGKIVIEP